MKNKNYAKKHIAFLAALLLILPVMTVMVGADTSSSGKMDYAGLLSRMDKYELDAAQSWHYSYKTVVIYPNDIMIPTFLYPRNEYASEDEFRKSERYEKIHNEIIAGVNGAGFPGMYYWVRSENISRAELVQKLIEFGGFDKSIAQIIADAIYSEDPRIIIETFLTPIFVVDPIAYKSNSVFAHFPSPETFTFYPNRDVCIYPSELLETPLETLETWNYSDEYWYDYYSFILFLNEDPSRAEDPVMLSAIFSPDELAEIERRLAIYAERIGKSPETGDNGNVRAAVLATVAVLAAVIPAAVLTVRRRRDK